ncbi:stabilizer of axonemal microtubules 4 [Opisthocomus hoazin]|uniref:stabilizer of axonemal microtubules 4 n=1 Tax=Opisthocomus hoazin TaxID=30419 RepID=UPI003F53C0B2
MARSGGSNDLMNVYARSYAVAHGCPRLRAHHGHHPSTGYVSNNYSAVSRLLCPRGEAEGYPHEALLACRRTGAMSPQLTPLLLSPPKASAVYDTGSRRTGPALPDVLRKTTIGAKATPRSNGVLPALLGQPLGVNITATDYRRPARRDPRQWMPCPSRPISVPQQGGKTLPVPPLGSQRGSGFSREVPGGLDTAGLLVVGHAMPLVSRGLQRPRRTQAGPLGQQGAGRKAGASMATSPPPSEHAPNPLPSPEEPSWFTRNHGQYVPSHQTPSPTAPDVLRKTTIGSKEPSSFAKATPRSNGVLPALLGQPLGVNITATDYRRPARRDPRQWMPCPSRPISVPQQGGKTLPVPPLGSQRGSGFSREVPGGLDTAGLLVVGHAMPLVSRGLQRPRRTQAGPLGQRSAGRKAGASMATSPPPLEHAPNPLPSPEEPSWFTGNHGQYVRPPPDAVPHSTSPVFDLDGETHGGHPAPAPQDQQPPHLAVEHHRPPPGVAPPAPGVPSPGFSGDPPDP